MKNPQTAVLATMLALPLAAAAQAPPAGQGAQPNISLCVGCHEIPGYQTSFPRVYHVPRIGGQSEKYLEAALHEYRKGERDHPTMRAIAAGLNDAQIAALAAYYAALGAPAR